MSSARRPSSVSRIARARSASPPCSDFDRSRNTARSAASAVSFDFPGMLGLHSPHPRQTIHPIAHSQAACLVEIIKLLGGLAGIASATFLIYDRFFQGRPLVDIRHGWKVVELHITNRSPET